MKPTLTEGPGLRAAGLSGLQAKLQVAAKVLRPALRLEQLWGAGEVVGIGLAEEWTDSPWPPTASWGKEAG